MVSIETARLVLREFEPSDFNSVHRYASDPRVVEHLSWGPNSEGDTRRFIEKAMRQRAADPRCDYELAVLSRSTGGIIGGCALYAAGRPENATCEIGYCFIPAVWGQGYGTEAVAALVSFGFLEAGLHRIFATIDVDNPASIRLVEGLGFRREGQMRADALIRGTWRDSLIYALLESELQPRQLSRE
ncbi:MAG: GNAT family N-acetyltransferase [Candidatus Binataceae bacterium]